MYSLGVVLYELLTGKKPFVGSNLEDLMNRIRKFERFAPSAVRPELPKSLDAVVLRALKKDPCKRYASWTDFALELSKVGELVLPPGAIPDSEKYVTLKNVSMLADARRCRALGARARRRTGGACRRASAMVQEDESGKSFSSSPRARRRSPSRTEALQHGEQRRVLRRDGLHRQRHPRRHATVEAMTELLVAEFEPAALERMSLGAQLQLTRALMRNVTDRLALANVRLIRREWSRKRECSRRRDMLKKCGRGGA